MSFDAREYWEERFKKNVSLSTTGYLGMGEVYNRWLYKGYLAALRRTLRMHALEPTESTSVADAGAGAGFLETYAEERGVKELTGFDFTEAAVGELKKRFPSYRFIRTDLTEPLPAKAEPADVVFCLSVLYHIVTEEGFSAALSNLSKLVREDGYIVIADNFMPVELPHASGSHQRHWSKERYEKEFSKLGLNVVGYFPIFFALNAPIRVAHTFWGGLYLSLWTGLQKFVAGNPRRERIFSPVAFGIDWALSKLIPRGPGSHYVLLRKGDGPDMQVHSTYLQSALTLWYRQSFKLILGAIAYNLFSIFILVPILSKLFPPLSPWERVTGFVTGTSRITYQKILPYVGPVLWMTGNAFFFAWLNRNFKKAKDEAKKS